LTFAVETIRNSKKCFHNALNALQEVNGITTACGMAGVRADIRMNEANANWMEG
jgi:hypothetical protein